MVQHGVDDRVVGVDHQGTLSLLLLQSGKIVLCLLCLASLQHPGKGRDVMPKIVRHFALCGVGAAQGINVGTLGAQLLVKRFCCSCARLFFSVKSIKIRITALVASRIPLEKSTNAAAILPFMDK